MRHLSKALPFLLLGAHVWAAPSSSSPTLALKPCGTVPGARCGALEVFEDRVARSGRTIGIQVMVLPATGPHPAPDPVFLFAGGPGQGAIGAYSGPGAEALARVRERREVVLVDQRGTGGSNPLQCALFGRPGDPASLFADIFPMEEVRACRARLEKNADLAKYGTSVAMDDLDDVRAALGYNGINLWGGSYGTIASQVYLRQHPEHVRAVVLEAVAALDYKLPLPFARGFQNAMERLLNDCAADATCSATVPKLRSELEELLARLDREPARFRVQEQEVTMTRGSFLEHLRLMLYSPEISSVVPLVLHRAHEGDFAPYARIVMQLSAGLHDSMSLGMYLSVTCSEGLAFATPEEITGATQGTWIGDYRVRTHAAACASWPKAAVPPEFIAPVAADVPVLLIAGDLDPVTPFPVARQVARKLSKSRLVRLPNGSHFTGGGCVDGLIAAFLEKGTAEGLDDSCAAAQAQRIPFAKELPAGMFGHG